MNPLLAYLAVTTPGQHQQGVELCDRIANN